MRDETNIHTFPGREYVHNMRTAKTESCRAELLYLERLSCIPNR